MTTNKTITHLLLCLLLTVSAKSGLSIDIDSFIEHYNRFDERLNSIEVSKNNARLQKEINENVDKGTISMKPYLTEGSYITGGVEVQYDHEFSVGTSAYVKQTFTRAIEESNIFFNEGSGKVPNNQSNQSRVLSLGVEHPLLKNGTVKIKELEWKSSKLQYEKNKQLVKEQTVENCYTASMQYIDAFYQKELLDIYQIQLENSLELEKRSVKDFERKLIQKSDFLSSQTDVLSSQKRLLETEYNLKSALANMYLPEETILQSPIKKLETAYQQTSSKKSTLQKEIAVKELEISHVELNKIREQEKNTVNVFFDVSQYNNVYDKAHRTTHSYTVGFNAKLPLFGHKKTQKIQIAANNVYEKRYQLHQIKLKQEKDIKKLKQKVDKYIRISNINKNLEKTVLEQLKEAEKDYQLQKTTFESYRLTRDNLLNLQIEFINQHKQKAIAILDTFKSTGHFPLICQEAL